MDWRFHVSIVCMDQKSIDKTMKELTAAGLLEVLKPRLFL